MQSCCWAAANQDSLRRRKSRVLFTALQVASCAYSQMHYASMLGNKFTVIDLAENHNMYYYNLVVHHRMTDRCASIRMINFPHERPGSTVDRPWHVERDKARRGEKSAAVDDAVEAAIAAIEEDGAEVITFGCSGAFWLQPFLQKRLNEIGWEVPVLEGYSCAITMAEIDDPDLRCHGKRAEIPRRPAEHCTMAKEEDVLNSGQVRLFRATAGLDVISERNSKTFAIFRGIFFLAGKQTEIVELRSIS